MSGYTPEALQKLVKDGIQTIEFLQQNPEDFQKTYGRSAIQEPSTRARIQAWESINPNNDNTSNKVQGGARNKEGANTSQSSRTPPADGGHGGKPADPVQKPTSSNEGSDKQVWDAEDHDGNRGRVGGGPSSGLQQTGERGGSVSTGDPQPEGYNPDGAVDVGEYNQISAMDHEMSSMETTGNATQLSTMRNATTEDFAKIFEEGTPKVHRRLRGITAVVASPGATSGAVGPVKKGTDESTVSTLLGDVQLSGNGAIRNVHPSLLHQPKENAHAENAQGSVPDVSATRSIGQSNTPPYNNQETEGKLDLIMRDLDIVSKKLDLLPEIKEEIKNINKKITNLSLGLSTVENYIKSMMIIIPGSGKDKSSESMEVNPDLRAVIGRDKTRGLKEVATLRSDLESLESGGHSNYQIDPKYITKDLDFTRSNAANFVPSDDAGSFHTIVAMIRSEIAEIRKQNDLINWVTDSMSKYPMHDLYKIVRELLDDYKETEEASDED